MPRLLPFRGLRPNPAFAPLDDVVCPPYDVISDQQRAELLARSPYNLVRVELPAGDYQGAANLLAHWKASGALLREVAPALYGYRMSYRGPRGEQRETLGVMGALVLEPPGHGILPHEHTTPKDKTDRLALIRATRANTSPIWCLYSEPGLSAWLKDDDAGRSRARDDDGVTHEMWPIFSPSAHQAISELAAAAPLLVADGHHRYETALTYQAEVARDGGPAGDTAGPGAVLALVVELSEQYLQVMAIHRAVSGLPAGTDVLEALAQGFELTRAATNGPALLDEMERAGALAVVLSGGSFLAKAKPGYFPHNFELDSSRVDAALAGLPPHQLSYEHDLGRALAGVREGRLDAAVLCRPATVAQIAATARGGERMPPKTTFFWPKPRTGMVLRDW